MSIQLTFEFYAPVVSDKPSYKSDRRRFLLSGVAIHKAVESGDIDSDWLYRLLDKAIERPADRRFLNLSTEKVNTPVDKCA